MVVRALSYVCFFVRTHACLECRATPTTLFVTQLGIIRHERQLQHTTATMPFTERRFILASFNSRIRNFTCKSKRHSTCTILVAGSCNKHWGGEQSPGLGSLRSANPSFTSNFSFFFLSLSDTYMFSAKLIGLRHDIRPGTYQLDLSWLAGGVTIAM